MSMIYHAWFQLENSVAWEKVERDEIMYSDYEKSIAEIRGRLEQIVEQKVFDIPSTDVKIIVSIDDLTTVHFSGQRNHYRSGPVDLMNWIKDNSPGAHGLLYLMNDEDGTLYDAYRVFQLSRNVITERIDRDLKRYLE